MEQHFSQINYLNNSYPEYLYQQHSCYLVNCRDCQKNYQPIQHFETLQTQLKNEFIDTNYTIFEPEYFLNTQNLDEFKIIEELALSSCNNDGFVCQSQQREQSFYEQNKNQYNFQLQSNNKINSLYHQQKQEESTEQNKSQSQLTQDLNNSKINKIQKQQRVKTNKNNNSNQLLDISFGFTQYINQIEKKSNNRLFQIKNNAKVKSSQLIDEAVSEKPEKQYSIKIQNGLKNIIFAFLSSFKQMKKCEFLNTKEMKDSQFKNVKKQLIRYMKQHSFNQSVVNYLVAHNIYKQFLLNYLDNESSVWLSKSKVIDKEEVYNQIIYLKNCIIDINQLDQMKANLI
ncbi:hypothetical protein ABPG72_006708 [Tetrahymena utriculariae]